jgi:hypothetical protein
MNVRELFRHKLEGAEIIPDPAVNAKLMRTLARREFIRFNPARFNAYYLGGIIVAAVTAGIMLFSEKEIPNRPDNTYNNPKIENALNENAIELPDSNSIIKENVDPSVTNTNGVKKNTSLQKSSKTTIEIVRESEQSGRNETPPATINNTISKKGLFTDSSVETDRLKERSNRSETILEASSLTGCVPLKLHFNAGVGTFDSCNWTFGDGGYSNKRSPDWIFDMEGEYKVVLSLYTEGKVQATNSTVVTVYPRPQARFEITPEGAVLPDDEIRFLNYSANAIKYMWSFGDGTYSGLFEPDHRYTKFSNYNVKLVVTSEFGCTDSLVVLNAFSGSEYFIDFPNAFIPNPDGPTGGYYSSKSDETGQVFHPTSLGVTDYQLRIFSKLGILIFESSDVNIGWDGYFKGQLTNPGVYIWKVRGSYRNGEPFVKMGDVTLLRN